MRIGDLIGHVFSRCLHGNESISVLGNELFQGKITLPFLFSCVQQLLVNLDLSFPLVVASKLAEEGHPSMAPVLRALKGLNRSRIGGGPRGLLELVVDYRVVLSK